MEHILYWLWLTGLFGVSAGKFLPFIKESGNIEEFYHKTTYPDSLTPQTIKKLNNKSLEWAKRIYAVCEENEIKIITFDSPLYPKMLSQIFIPPALLYAKGIIPDWDNLLMLGVVGTRSATEYGINVTTDICTGLAKKGVTIVSGFAKGIDSAATKSAINSNAYNITVCASGLNVKYPKANNSLREPIIKNGLMLSEYPPGTPPLTWTFRPRNRIIAGLSKGVLVTEAPENSGALITANWALEENRDVFAVPGKIDDKNSKGINRLIKNGAKPVFSADDILFEYPHYTEFLTPPQESGMTETFIEKPAEKKSGSSSYTKHKKIQNAPEVKKPVYGEITKTGTEGEILKLLTDGDMHIDELIRKINVPVNHFNTAVMMLEICGDVKRLAGNIFHREK